MLKPIKRLLALSCVALVSSLVSPAAAEPTILPADLQHMHDILMRPNNINSQLGMAWTYIPFNDFSNYFFENFFIDLADEGHSTDDGQAILIDILYKNQFVSSDIHPFNWDDRGQGRWDGNYWVRYQDMIITINSLLNDLNTPGSELAAAIGSDNFTAISDELRVLRAFYYLQATRLYGDFPIWESYNIDYTKQEQSFIQNYGVLYPEINIKPVFHSDLRRNPAAEVFKYVVSECQAAIAANNLPWHQTSDQNRMTLGIACAVMSQAALYAASPLYNGGQDLWQWAYQVNEAAFNGLTKNGYELYSQLADANAYLNAYQEYFALDSHDGNTPSDKETIWGSPQKYRAEGLYVVNGIPVNEGLFKVGTCPTQDLIDAYDMKATGKPIYNLTNPYADESKLVPNIDPASGYDETKPYEGRDDRFYANTFYNGCKFAPVSMRKTVATWNNSDENHWGTPGGRKGVDAIDAHSRLQTRTGYYNRKFHQYKENRNTRYAGGNWKLFRLGEVYLNFAEAAIESGNINKGLELINAIRHRAGFASEVDVTATTKDYARLLVRHERQVELAFEGQRYYDVRRWKTPGTDVTEEKIKTGMWITSPDNGKTFQYHRFVIDPYGTGITSEFYIATNQLAALPNKTVLELATVSGMDNSYWQNPGHNVPDVLKFTILSEEEKTCALSGHNSYLKSDDGSLTIPSTVELFGATYTVTAINEGALSGLQQLTSVEIPATITSIGENPFRNCPNLTQIKLADGNINYSSVDGVIFNKNMTELLIFPAGKGTEYTIPTSVRVISNGAFATCSKLASVSIPNSVTVISNGAFAMCSQLASVSIPNSITVISNSTFYGCSELKEIEIPNSVTSLGESAFAYSGLMSISIPNSVTAIGDGAFYNCINLASVSIPSSVTSIGFSTFSSCLYLTSVSLPNSIISIGAFAFSNCGALLEFTIPNSVTSLGEGVFSECSNLTKITIPNSVTEIGRSAFSYCSNLATVSLPNSINSISYGAFYGCRGLKSVSIPNSVTDISDDAFSHCSSLASVSIPNSVTHIGYGAFYGCTGLTELEIPNSVTVIENYAFYNCSSLSSVFYNCEDPIEGSYYIFDGSYGATLFVPAAAVEKCKAIDPWKNFNTIQEHAFSGIDDIAADIDFDAPYEVYNVSGVMIGNTTTGIAPGIYIVRQGSKTMKIAIK